MEVWNNVFTQFEGDGKGGYTGKPSFYYENKEEQELPYEYSYRQDFDTNMVTLPTVHNKNSKVINTAPETEEIKRRRRWTVHSTLKCVDANAFWNIKKLQKFIIQLKWVNIKKHCAAGVCIIGNMRFFTAESPGKPGIDGSSKKLSVFCTGTNSRNIV